LGRFLAMNAWEHTLKSISVEWPQKAAVEGTPEPNQTIASRIAYLFMYIFHVYILSTIYSIDKISSLRHLSQENMDGHKENENLFIICVTLRLSKYWSHHKAKEKSFSLFIAATLLKFCGWKKETEKKKRKPRDIPWNIVTAANYRSS